MSKGEPVPVLLMNTIWADTDGLHDDLTTVADLRTWLIATGTAGRSVCTRADLAKAQLLRDALRRLAMFHTDDERDRAPSPLTDLDEAISVVNDLAAQAQRDRLDVRDGRLALEHVTDSTTAALADIATEAIALVTGSDSAALRACCAPGCVRYFTESHPRREWCSQACGNRVRAARHYRRVRRDR